MTNSKQNYNPLVLIQNGYSDVRPLFCVPGAGASVTSFYELSQALDPVLPIYGLQPRGLDCIYEPHSDVCSSASFYIESIREVCPGPYRLLGHSFGGWVVFEMALQLLEIGEEVEVLVLLDTEPPSLIPRLYSRVETLLELVKLYEMSINSTLGLSEKNFLGLDTEQQLNLLLYHLIKTNIMPARASVNVLRGIVKVFEINLNTHYYPAFIYDRSLNLVHVSDQTSKNSSGNEDSLEQLESWRFFAPKANMWIAPGNHITMLAQPNVSELAEWLKQLILIEVG